MYFSEKLWFDLNFSGEVKMFYLLASSRLYSVDMLDLNVGFTPGKHFIIPGREQTYDTKDATCC